MKVPRERNQHRTTPMRYLAAMAALMAASAWLAVADRQTRAEDESRVLPTALGDFRWHPSGTGELAPRQMDEPLARFEGKALFPRSRSVRMVLSERMEAAGKTDNNQWTVYRLTGRGDNEGEAGEMHLMVGQDPEDSARGLFRPVVAKSPVASGADNPASANPTRPEAAAGRSAADAIP